MSRSHPGQSEKYKLKVAKFKSREEDREVLK